MTAPQLKAVLAHGRYYRRAPSLLPKEKAIQAAVVDHWRAFGLPGTLVAAIPNAGALGQPGLTAGLADLLVIAPALPNGAKVGFIELKRTARSPVSEAQHDFGALCLGLCIPYVRTYGRDEPIDILERWGVVRKAVVACR